MLKYTVSNYSAPSIAGYSLEWLFWIVSKIVTCIFCHALALLKTAALYRDWSPCKVGASFPGRNFYWTLAKMLWFHDCTGWYTSSTQLECPSRNGNHHTSVNVGWVNWYCINRWLNVKEKCCHMDCICQYSLRWCLDSIYVMEIIHAEYLKGLLQSQSRKKNVLGNPGVIIHACTCI